MTTGIIMLGSIMTYLTGWVASTAFGVRYFADNVEYCHKDRDRIKSGCAYSRYSERHEDGCWGRSKTGEVEIWMLWYVVWPALAWPILAWPALAFWLAKRKPTTRAERLRYENLVEEHERVLAEQETASDDAFAAELERTRNASVTELESLGVRGSVHEAISAIRRFRR